MFVPRSVFEDVGGFRNPVSEDLDWGQRAASRGYRLIVDGSALIGHPGRTDWHALRRKWQRLTRESFYLERGRFARFVWLARSWAVLLSPLFHVYIVARTRSLRGFRARLGAAWILLRIRSFRFAEAHRLMLSAGRSDPQGATVAVRPAPTGEVASSSPHVVIAIVGYRDPDDIRGCLKALSRSRHSNFSIEICENGGVAAYEALIAAMGDIAILDATPARPRGARVVRRTDGRLIPGGQSLSLCLAAVNGGYAGGFNICLAEVADGPK